MPAVCAWKVVKGMKGCVDEKEELVPIDVLLQLKRQDLNDRRRLLERAMERVW